MKVLRTVCKFEPGQPGRTDRVVQELTGLSRAGVRGLVDHGCVRINGEPATAAHAPLHAGDVVEIRYDPAQRYREKPKPRNDPHYRILFEDPHIIVVEKSAGILTVPAPGGTENTLVSRLQKHLNRGRGDRLKAHVVGSPGTELEFAL